MLFQHYQTISQTNLYNLLCHRTSMCTGIRSFINLQPFLSIWKKPHNFPILLPFFFLGLVPSFLSTPRNLSSSKFLQSLFLTLSLIQDSNFIYYFTNLVYVLYMYLYVPWFINSMTPFIARCTITLSTTKKNENAANLKTDACQ